MNAAPTSAEAARPRSAPSAAPVGAPGTPWRDRGCAATNLGHGRDHWARYGRQAAVSRPRPGGDEDGGRRRRAPAATSRAEPTDDEDGRRPPTGGAVRKPRHHLGRLVWHPPYREYQWRPAAPTAAAPTAWLQRWRWLERRRLGLGQQWWPRINGAGSVANVPARVERRRPGVKRCGSGRATGRRTRVRPTRPGCPPADVSRCAPVTSAIAAARAAAAGRGALTASRPAWRRPSGRANRPRSDSTGRRGAAAGWSDPGDDPGDGFSTRVTSVGRGHRREDRRSRARRRRYGCCAKRSAPRRSTRWASLGCWRSWYGLHGERTPGSRPRRKGSRATRSMPPTR